MTLDDFGILLDRCGGEQDTWPPGAAAAAARLLATSPEARASLGAQQEVERWLAASTLLRPDGDEVARRAVRSPQLAPRAPARELLRGWGLAAAAASVAAVALGLGAVAGAPHGPSSEPAQALAAALAVPGEDADAA